MHLRVSSFIVGSSIRRRAGGARPHLTVYYHELHQDLHAEILAYIERSSRVWPTILTNSHANPTCLKEKPRNP
jgi:hypothetical protein